MANIFLAANNAGTVLGAPINNSTTEITLAVGTGSRFPSPATNEQFVLSLTDAATKTNREICYCTSRTGDVCTVVRAQEGTSASPWLAGDIAANLMTSGTLDAMQNYESITINEALDTLFSNSPCVNDFQFAGGAIGNGTHDDTTAWNAAVTAQNNSTIFGNPNSTYKITAPIMLPSGSITIDLNGATMRPSGDTLLFDAPAITPAATTVVASGNTIGTRALTVSSTAGLAPNQQVCIRSNNSSLEENIDYPSTWAKILSIVGSVVTIDEPLIVTYLGTVTLYAWNTFRGTLYIKNGIIDLSQSAYTASALLGAVINANNYAVYIDENIKIIGMNYTTRTIQPVTTLNCIKVISDQLIALNNIGLTSIASHRYAAVASYLNSHIDGSHFGLQTESCGEAKYIGGQINGRLAQEIAAGASPLRSVRAIKDLGSGRLVLVATESNDFKSSVKIEESMDVVIEAHISRNGGTFPGTGEGCISVTPDTPGGGSSRVKSIHIKSFDCYNYGGYPMLVVDPNAAMDIDSIKVIRCAQQAIYSNGLLTRIFSADIKDWDINGDNEAAIQIDSAGYAHSLDNINFSNGVTTVSPCIKVVSTNTHLGLNITCETANDLYDATSVQPILVEDTANRALYVNGVVAPFKKSGSDTIVSQILRNNFFSCNLGQVFSFTAAAGAIEFAVSDSAGNFAAKFFADFSSATISILSDPSSHYQNTTTGSPAPASGKVGVYKAANSSTISFYNNVGNAISFSIFLIGQATATTDPV